MAGSCSCCSDGGLHIHAKAADDRPGAGRTVGDVVAARPGALAVMQRFGINHCCGAGLTLAEAAAAAGADLPALLDALSRA
jgi:iron-sulfur cluster repair protein YtfE (RIC family)